jgi:hypothetical protein
MTPPNKITPANAGWRIQFRFAGSRHRPGVAEFGSFGVRDHGALLPDHVLDRA